MNILADTHMLIWSLLDDDKLSSKAKAYILSNNNKIYYSVVSVWEVAIKHKAHSDQMKLTPEIFNEYCKKAGYILLDGMVEHVLTLSSLKTREGMTEHKDPFDRLLIAQAKYENMIFLTHDGKMQNFNEDCILTV